MPRLLVALALAGCFTPRTHAERPRALAYNLLAIAGGIAAAAAGYELFRATEDSDGLGPFIGGMGLAAGVSGGAFLVVGGAAGIALSYLDYAPTH